MQITAAIIMRNEAPLIAAKMAGCCAWAEELIVIDQKSEDGSAIAAQATLELLDVPGEVVAMEGEVLGKEFSFAQAFEEAKGNWVVFTDVDEILVLKRSLGDVLSKVPLECHAPRIERWQGVVSQRGFFKKEEFWEKRFRFLRKPGAHVFRPDTPYYQDLLHKREPVGKDAEEPCYRIPREEAFLLEVKASHQHVADQFFYQAVGSRNDLDECQAALPDADLELGRLLFEWGHRQHHPDKPGLAKRISRRFRKRSIDERSD